MAIRILPVAVAPGGDTTAPVVTIHSITAGKISRIAGKDSTDIGWSADEDFTSYQIRLVPTSESTVTQGTLIEQDQNPAAGGVAGTIYTSTVTDDELVTGAGIEGNNIVKIFVRDAAGNWSDSDTGGSGLLLPFALPQTLVA